MTLTVPEETYVHAFAPQIPLGVHPVIFDVSETPSRPDDAYACQAATLGERKLPGAGVGTEKTELPPGVAMPLRAGQQLFMNLHLLNTTSRPLRVVLER